MASAKQFILFNFSSCVLALGSEALSLSVNYFHAPTISTRSSHSTKITTLHLFPTLFAMSHKSPPADHHQEVEFLSCAPICAHLRPDTPGYAPNFAFVAICQRPNSTNVSVRSICNAEAVPLIVFSTPYVKTGPILSQIRTRYDQENRLGLASMPGFGFVDFGHSNFR